jgi:hypothetical protein
VVWAQIPENQMTDSQKELYYTVAKRCINNWLKLTDPIFPQKFILVAKYVFRFDAILHITQLRETWLWEVYISMPANSHMQKTKFWSIWKWKIYRQWENISITSKEVDFWGVKSSGCKNSHAIEVKCSNIPQKS